MKTKRVKIWAVTEGPYNLETLTSNYPYEIPPDCNHLVVCKVENRKKLIDKEFWFENEEDAHKFKLHIDSKMEATIIYAPQLEEPFELEYEDE
tara:strand:- start:156 stop:434 length:279 start_codon:yes stop_codon:yes gene_type:complete